MTVSATFLYAVPHQKIATVIRDRLARCQDARIVSGFATPDGVEALRVGTAARKITQLVLGAGTFKAFQALDALIAAGLPASAARLHLGHTRSTGWAKNPFERLRPMLHSKIYYFEMPDGTAAAFVGSHNLTGFALRGMNGEAAILLEGPATDPAFVDIRKHIEAAYKEATTYDAQLKEAYARWYADWFDRLKTSISEGQPRPAGGRTLLVVAECGPGRVPTVGQALYFEIDKRIERVSAIDAEVHVLLFDRLPPSPRAALAARGAAKHAFRAKVQAIDARAGAAEINTDWFVDPGFALQRAPPPFRPTLSAGKQQVTVEIERPLDEHFEYEFGPPDKWIPELEPEAMRDDETGEQWSRVLGLLPEHESEPLVSSRKDGAVTPQMRLPLLEYSPDSGSYILLSRGRRRRDG